MLRSLLLQLVVGGVLMGMPSFAGDGLVAFWHEDEGLGLMPAVPDLAETDSFSLTLRASWIKSETGRYPNLLSAQDWGGYGGMLFFVRDGRLSFRVGSNYPRLPEKVERWHETEWCMLDKVSTNVWTSLAVTFERPNLTCYVNGKVVARGKWNEPFRMRGFELGRWGGEMASRHKGRLDDLRIFNRELSEAEVKAMAQEATWQGVPKASQSVKPFKTFTGRTVTMMLDQVGRIASLKEIKTGRELLEDALPFVTVRFKGAFPMAARRVEARDNNHLAFILPTNYGEVLVRVDEFGNKDGWSFAIEDIKVRNFESARFMALHPVCTKYCGTMANALSDDSSAVVLRAYDVALDMNASKAQGLFVTAEKEHTWKGTRFGLVAGPRAEIIPQLREMSKVSGAPLSKAGGAWSLGSEANRGSYVFADMSLASVADWIDLAKRGGLEYLHLHGWWQWLGQYPVNRGYFPNGLEDMKKAVEQIHASGLKAGMHSLTACIDPYHDPWISPVCNTNLVADATYTLAENVGVNDTEIQVNEKPANCHDLVFTYASNGNFLRIGNEVVQYTGIRREKPYAFLGCKRGYFKTKPATYVKGTTCDYLHQRYIAFYPHPDSALAVELADKLANVRNVCGIDSFYFDGSEGMGKRYAVDMLRRLIFGRFTVPPVAEASCWGAHSWWFHSRLGAWDHAVWAAKRFHDEHLRTTIETARMANFLEPQLGWWQAREGSKYARGHYSEEMEYFAGKNVGFDAPMSQQGVNVTYAPLNEFHTRQMTLLGWYERPRLACAFTPEACDRLRQDRSEFRLRQNNAGVWQLQSMTSVAQRVTGTTGKAGEVAQTMKFSLAKQPQDMVLRVEALYGVDTQDARGTNFLSIADVKQMRVSNASYIKGKVEPIVIADKGEGARFTAVNNCDKTEGAWVQASRSYVLPYMSVGPCEAFALWVNGDGSGAILNVQLRMGREYFGALSEHYIKLDFKGWRYFTLLARERDADSFADLKWGYRSYIGVCRDPFDSRHIERVSLALNNVPAHGSTCVEVAGLRAVPTTKPTLQPQLTVNGQAVKLPFMMNAGDYAEWENGAWIRYAENGTSLERVVAPMPCGLRKGENTCALQTGRAEVTFLVYGEKFDAFKQLTATQRSKMTYEALLPCRYQPSKGFDVMPFIAVRPGEKAKLELQLIGAVEEPILDFGALGKWCFPVTVKAGERLECRDGLHWRVLTNKREVVAEGTLSKALPILERGTDWKLTSKAPNQANVRVNLVKNY